MTRRSGRVAACRQRRLYSAAPQGGLSGGVICALDHLCAVRADFDEVCLILCEPGPLERRAAAAGIPICCFPLVFRGLRRAGPGKIFLHAGAVLRSRWRYLLGVRRLLKTNPGILHVHSRAAHLPYVLVAGWLARVPIVVTIHEPGGMGSEAWLDEWLIRRMAHRIVYLTEAMKNQYPRLPAGRGFVVGNPGAWMPPSDRPPGDPPRLTMLAGMTKMKGIDLFLETCARLKDRGVDFVAEMAGGWPSAAEHRTATEYLNRHGLDALVKISGLVEDVDSLYARTDVLLLPTRRDSYPRVVMEAMCRGIPVVATRVDGIPEMVVDGATGFLVEAEDVAGFAEAAARLLKDASLRRKMGAASHARAKDLFSPATYRRKMAAVYAGLEARP